MTHKRIFIKEYSQFFSRLGLRNFPDCRATFIVRGSKTKGEYCVCLSDVRK